jgi:hypothetical protein
MRIVYFQKNDKLNDLLISLAIFSAGIITRLPFAQRFFNYWDGVQFALSMKKYSLSEGLPGPPGYYLYVMLVKAVDRLFNNPNFSLTLVSILGSGLFSVIVYWLGKAILGRTKGIWASLIVLAAPWFWFYGTTTVPYLVCGFLSGCAILGFYYAIIKKEKLGLYWGTLGFALLGGIRHQEVLFIAPLYIWALFNFGAKEAIRSLALFGLICLGWLLPEIINSGSLQAYMQLLKGYRYDRNIFTMSFNEIKTNFTIKIKILLLLYGIGILPFFYQLHPFFNLRNIVRKRMVRFFVILILPSAIFWIFFLGELPGYFMSALIGTTIYLVWAIDMTNQEIADVINDFKLFKSRLKLCLPVQVLNWVFVILLVAINAFVYFYDFNPKAKANNEYLYQSRSDTKKKDLMLENKLRYIKSFMDPQSTAVITTNWIFMQAMYYLPNFHVYLYGSILIGEKVDYRKEGFGRIRYFQEHTNNVFEFPREIAQVVLFDEDFADWIVEGDRLETLDVGDGYHLYIIKRPPSGKIFFGKNKVFF